MRYPSELYPQYEEFKDWDEFLKRWPLEKVKNMTLEEYSNLDREDSYTYWLESKTSPIISIWGGSSYKFGVFKRNQSIGTENLRTSQKSDGEYGWYAKYGNSAEEAFEKVKDLIVKVIECSLRKDFSCIDDIDLGHAYKWKIAFMYAEPGSIPGIVSGQALRKLAKLHECSYNRTSYILKCLLEKKPDNQDFWKYTQNLWKEWEEYSDRIESMGFSETRQQAEEKIVDSNYIKNIILYGPPGTGKTVNYRRIVDMIESGESIKSVFGTVKDNNFLEDEFSHYKTAEAEGRVQFVTFHQNFSYEDFVEGYRPDKSGQIIISEGVFKGLCNNEPDCYLSVGEKYGKYEIVSISDEIMKIKKDNGYIVPVPFCTYRRLLSGLLSGKIKLEDLKDGREAELPSKLDDCNDPYIVNGYGSIWYQLCSAAIKKMNSSSGGIKTKNKYLIIDEINRGNISKIFGELITLIEEDKRGKLTVTLPYSKEPFTVPENLYIIATMNSTDKSIALIDVALRRRFTFVKMMPNTELVENDKAKKVMIELNRFITEKLGEDFQVGHSYFMTDDLDFAIDYKIVPLLEEYFFADAEGLREAKRIVGREEKR